MSENADSDPLYEVSILALRTVYVHAMDIDQALERAEQKATRRPTPWVVSETAVTGVKEDDEWTILEEDVFGDVGSLSD